MVFSLGIRGLVIFKRFVILGLRLIEPLVVLGNVVIIAANFGSNSIVWTAEEKRLIGGGSNKVK